MLFWVTLCIGYGYIYIYIGYLLSFWIYIMDVSCWAKVVWGWSSQYTRIAMMFNEKVGKASQDGLAG